MAMGQPYITLKVEMPVGFEGLNSEFLKLENDSQFHDEVRDLVKKRLLLDSHHKKSL